MGGLGWIETGARIHSDGESLFRDANSKRKAEEARVACLNSASLHYWSGRSYVRPAEVAGPLAAHKNPRKAQIHVGSPSNWNRQTAMLWEAIGPLPDSSERHEGGCFSANRTGRDAPANTGQAARRYAIDSSAPDQVFKKEFCSSDPSIAWLLL